MSIEDKTKVAKLVRLLSSDNDNEVLATTRAIRKTCSLNELGDLIEGGSKLSKAEMKVVYDAAFKDGFEKGKQEERVYTGATGPVRPSWDNVPEYQQPIISKPSKWDNILAYVIFATFSVVIMVLVVGWTKVTLPPAVFLVPALVVVLWCAWKLSSPWKQVVWAATGALAFLYLISHL